MYFPPLFLIKSSCCVCVSVIYSKSYFFPISPIIQEREYYKNKPITINNRQKRLASSNNKNKLKKKHLPLQQQQQQLSAANPNNKLFCSQQAIPLSSALTSSHSLLHRYLRPSTICARCPLVRGSWVLKIFGNLEKALITATSDSVLSSLAMRKT